MIILTTLLLLLALIFILSFVWYCIHPFACIGIIVYIIYLLFNPPKPKDKNNKVDVNGEDVWNIKQAEHIKNITFNEKRDK